MPVTGPALDLYPDLETAAVVLAVLGSVATAAFVAAALAWRRAERKLRAIAAAAEAARARRKAREHALRDYLKNRALAGPLPPRLARLKDRLDRQAGAR